MPQASLDLSKVGQEPFAVAAHHQAEVRPRVSEVKSLTTLHKKSRPVESPKVVEVTESGVVKEKRTSEQSARPLSVFGPDRNEIGLPLRTFKAVLSEPVDV